MATAASSNNNLRQRGGGNKNESTGDPSSNDSRSQPGRRMLYEIQQQDLMDREQEERLDEYRSQSFQQYLKTFLVILVLGVAACLYFQPRILTRLLAGRKKLPRRQIITVGLEETLQALPRFYGPYAIATPENLFAREQVKQMAHLKSKLGYTGSIRQTVDMHTWTLQDFQQQVQMDRRNRFCQHAQFDSRYTQSSNRTKEKLVAYCLIQNGYYDGYVDRNYGIHGVITRGIKGVVAQVHQHDRILDDFILFPIESDHHKNKSQKSYLSPTTKVPSQGLQSLVQLLGEDSFNRHRFQQILYHLAKQEQEAFVWLNAACTDEDRALLGGTQRLLATTCNVTASTSSPACCSIYDPKGRPSSSKQ